MRMRFVSALMPFAVVLAAQISANATPLPGEPAPDVTFTVDVVETIASPLTLVSLPAPTALGAVVLTEVPLDDPSLPAEDPRNWSHLAAWATVDGQSLVVLLREPADGLGFTDAWVGPLAVTLADILASNPVFLPAATNPVEYHAGGATYFFHAIPEPSTLALSGFSLSVLLLAAARRRRHRIRATAAPTACTLDGQSSVHARKPRCVRNPSAGGAFMRTRATLFLVLALLAMVATRVDAAPIDVFAVDPLGSALKTNILTTTNFFHAIPEPSTLALCSFGLCPLVFVAARRRWRENAIAESSARSWRALVLAIAWRRKVNAQRAIVITNLEGRR